MKNIYRISLTFLVAVLLCVDLAYSQQGAPQMFNYQGIARDGSGTPLATQSISLRISIREGSGIGLIVYQETHAVTTNQFGLFDIQVGNGTPVSGVFSDGFQMHTSPQTHASIVFHDHTATGKLKALITPIGPKGCHCSYIR